MVPPDPDPEAEALVHELCRTLADAKLPGSSLNMISLLAAGLMSWSPHGQPIDRDLVRGVAADLVLHAVGELMIRITELTLDDNASH